MNSSLSDSLFLFWRSLEECYRRGLSECCTSTLTQTEEDEKKKALVVVVGGGWTPKRVVFLSVCTCVAFFGTAFRLLSCAIPFWISFRSSSIVWNRTRFYTLLRDWRLITKNELKFWNTSTASADATATTTNMMRQIQTTKNVSHTRMKRAEIW